MASSTRGDAKSAPALSVSRFGRTDFEWFDHEAARGSQYSLATEKIGSVNIDCTYHWKKAQWGVLGPDSKPAGIVYLDLAFKQPYGSQLLWASVYVTIGQDDSSYALSTRAKRALTAQRGTGYEVQINPNFGPHQLKGPPVNRTEMKSWKFTPTFAAAGFELGGMGRESQKISDKCDRWQFKGELCRPHNQEGLRTLHWFFEQNEQDPNQGPTGPFHTAFAFEHSRDPVYMRVEIVGKLLSRSSNAKLKTKRFASSLYNKDHSTLSRIDFTGTNFTKSIDDIAGRLREDMQSENIKDIAIEMPGPITALPALGDVSHASPYSPTSPHELGMSATTLTNEGPQVDFTSNTTAMLDLLSTVRTKRSSDLDTAATSDTGDQAALDAEYPGKERPSSLRDALTLRDEEDAVMQMLKVPVVLYLLRGFVLIAEAFSRLTLPPLVRVAINPDSTRNNEKMSIRNASFSSSDTLVDSEKRRASLKEAGRKPEFLAMQTKLLSEQRRKVAAEETLKDQIDRYYSEATNQKAV